MALCSDLGESGFIVPEGPACPEEVHVNKVCHEVIEGLDGGGTRTIWGEI